MTGKNKMDDESLERIRKARGDNVSRRFITLIYTNLPCIISSFFSFVTMESI